MPHQQPGRLPDGMADCLCSPAAKGGPSANWKQNTSAPFLHRWPGGPCRWHTPRPCFGLTAKCWATKGLQQREGCRTAPAPDQAPAPVACCQVAHTHDDGRAALRQAQRCFIAQAAVGARDHYHLAMWRCVCGGGEGGPRPQAKMMAVSMLPLRRLARAVPPMPAQAAAPRHAKQERSRGRCI